MDKLLIIKENKKIKIDEPLAVSSAPSRSVDNVLYSPEVEELKSWLTNGVNDAGFLCGSCGSGVSTLIKTVLTELNLEPYFINHNEKDFANQLVVSNITNTSVTGKKIIIVVDGLDSTSADKRCLNTISEHVIKGSSNKILCAGHYGRSTKSNEFAQKWKNFQLKTPSNDRIVQELIRINAGVLPDDCIREIVFNQPTGDIRSCINTLEMELKLQTKNGSNSRDIFVDGIDSIEFMFNKKNEHDFNKIYKIYEQEPMMISMGVYENYINSFHKSEIDIVSSIADGLSVSDVIYEKINIEQNWSQLYGHCAHSVCNTAMLRRRSRSKDTIKVEKFCTIWSKINNQKLNSKKINTIEMVRAENGLPFLDVLELSYVRYIIKQKINSDEKDFIDTCYPWGQEEILLLFRTGFEPYKHAKVKKIFERHSTKSLTKSLT
ncbi:replication factor C [Paramecium bursaria Chlorella virus KS1B]|nr:replication factor C [Paramecium bursaria Chlorella virus KS1B]